MGMRVPAFHRVCHCTNSLPLTSAGPSLSPTPHPHPSPFNCSLVNLTPPPLHTSDHPPLQLPLLNTCTPPHPPGHRTMYIALAGQGGQDHVGAPPAFIQRETASW